MLDAELVPHFAGGGAVGASSFTGAEEAFVELDVVSVVVVAAVDDSLALSTAAAGFAVGWTPPFDTDGLRDKSITAAHILS